MFPFVLAFFDRCKGHEWTAALTWVHILYSEIVFDVTGEIEQWLLSQDELKQLNERMSQFKRMLVETFMVHYDSGLYTITYHLIVQIVENLGRF